MDGREIEVGVLGNESPTVSVPGEIVQTTNRALPFRPASAFSGDDFLALGRLRGRIQRALATRHLEERPSGDFVPLHDTLRGRISYSSEEDEVAFVIDGKSLKLSQFTKMVQMYEGWQFRLDFLEEGDEVR